MALELSAVSFEDEVIKSEVPVLVDFYANWCGPCKMMGPVIEELSKEYEGKAKVCKVNVDENGALAQQYSVMSIPALLIFKGGEIVDTVVGAVPKPTLEAKLKAQL